jgi:hypothetical protein
VTITTDEQFNTLLTKLLIIAQNGDVDVTGVWECDNHGARTDWEVEILELLVEEVDDD